MSQPIQTLHEFVFNLISNADFGSAFLSDPASALSAAGLGDITGADVQEVTPLVTDSMPAPVADAVESGLASLPTDAFGTDDLHCALTHLETVASVAQSLPDTALSTAGTLSSVTDAMGVSGTFQGSADGLATGMLASTPAGDVTGALAATTGSLGAGMESPLGTYGITTDSLPLSVPSFGSVSDLGGTLDSAALTGGTPVTETATSYVTSGTEMATSGIANGSAMLGDHISTAGTGLGGAVTAGGADLANHVTSAVSMAGDLTSNLPTVSAPVHLPADLPVHVVAQPPALPAADAAVPQVTHTVESTVSHASVLPDSLSHGSLAGMAHSAVPGVDSLHTDLLHGELPLGH
ncbi:IniB N-terminal domain-containing protein [Amycolatopsis alkalitolerans]|uniref:Uncharacterized protein n=1 Tax=Amycolatopsis alkalitolerans TaxID=2547244 RepID=A0A5C4LZC8_9PSEU|nr:IniB N-terminal domain-containing protein [Amycolatopsis alkalitolerans]TNC23439.1 hypothetical protein FG385_22155 [Amycolatopsis alkalitolerans]